MDKCNTIIGFIFLILCSCSEHSTNQSSLNSPYKKSQYSDLTISDNSHSPYVTGSFNQQDLDVMNNASLAGKSYLERKKAEAREYAAAHNAAASASNNDNSSREFSFHGKNDMTVTYDKLAGSSPLRGVNTIIVSSGQIRYRLTYSFHPGAYLLEGGGDLTGQSVNVKFDSGTPVSIKNYTRGDGYVVVSSFSRL